MKIVNFKKNINTYTENGFALLFAVLTAGLLLTIGISIFNVSFKELLISTAARESQIAFYAADSARECVLYWDTKKGAFSTCLNNNCGVSERTAGLSKIKCNNIQTDLIISGGNYPNTYYRLTDFFKYDSSNNLAPQATVNVTKTYLSSENKIETSIDSLGHNVGDTGRRLEREIFQSY